LAVPSGDAYTADDGAERRHFCCLGCLGAYRLITGAGLEAFYTRRTDDGLSVPVSPASDQAHFPYLDDYVYDWHGDKAIDLLIDGIRCAACIWLNERMVSTLPGVTDVRINYATGRARIAFSTGLVTPAEIASRISSLGYSPRPYTASTAEQSAAAERQDLLIRFGTAVFLSMQLMAYAIGLYAGYFQGITPDQKNYLNWFSLLVTTPVVFYSGWPFIAGAWRSLRNATPTMDLLIATGAISAYCVSLQALLTGGEGYFETAAMIVTLILAGRLLELGAKRTALAGIERFRELAPSHAVLVRNGSQETVSVSTIEPGDLVRVDPHSRFPVDGVIVDGETEADESPASGEPLPVAKYPGSAAIAGSINLLQPVLLRAERRAADSFVARIGRLVEEAQQNKAPIHCLADRVAALFIPVVLCLAAGTLLVLLHGGMPATQAVLRALTVVLIACPCALGLATPTAILTGTGAAAARGVIFRGGDVVERLAGITRIVFDKTGTLTCGEPRLRSLMPAAGITVETLLVLAASLEAKIDHPLARGVTAAADKAGLMTMATDDVSIAAGRGVTGSVAGETIVVGNARHLTDHGIPVPPLDQSGLPAAGTVVFVGRAGAYLGAVVLEDQLRPGMADFISSVKAGGLEVSLFSGDRQVAATEIARLVGIGDARGNLSPADKARLLENLQQEGDRVLMVGDGINDAPALASAVVGCAFAGGTAIAIDTSDIILSAPDPRLLAFARQVAGRTMTIIRQNLAWAFIYNLVGIPLAMTGMLTPVYAAAAMTVSSLCVVGNSLRLRNISHG
jgi:Cu2+-exporting ATPase